VNCPVTEDSSTPLHKACAGSKPGHLAAVKLLLETGADVHALNKWRETPLLTAANHGQSGAVDALLAAGADPCKCTDTGWSPLSIAAYKGHDDVVSLLLEEGAPTEEDDPTLSALLQAATKGLPDTVELLLRHGADHTVTTKKGDTALSILVEQNLIDAAVEMVSEYNASIPRCSRDRKKVQRARLLINLRMKQLERENGKNESTDDEEEESDEDGEETMLAQHEDGQSNDSSTQSKKRKNRAKPKIPKAAAEEKARAAEEALLLELEREETKAKKDSAAANSKRQRKKEKKDREKQMKLDEERARREKEEKETNERDRMRREQEERERREREQKLQLDQEREKKEIMEREKILTAKRREREQKEKKERDRLSKQEQAKVEQTKPPRQKAAKHNGASPKAAKATSPASGTRRWETKPKAKSPSRHAAPASPPTVRSEPILNMPHPSLDIESSAVDTAPKIALAPRSSSDWNDLSTFAGVVESNTPRRQLDLAARPETGVGSQFLGVSIEHPAISIFRREKVVELLSRCAQSFPVVEDALLKRVLYCWTLRAAHDPSRILDPIIPSWTESERVITFFQRQLIAASRRGGAIPSGGSMEILKEAGASIAKYCQNLAREIDQFRQRIEEHLPMDWTDSALGMTVSDGSLSGRGAIITVSWASRAQVVLPTTTFGSLRERHVGPSSRFLASCFMAKTLYDTKRLISGGSSLDFRLSAQTKACLRVVAGVSAELWSDPFSVENGNVFWGTLETVDSLFGGQRPFVGDQLGGEEVLATHGGSLAVFLPLDAMTAANYVRRMLDVLVKTQITNVPVSFIVVAHASCFVDLPNGPSGSDIHQLDPRLHAEHNGFVRCTEVLTAGRHSFQHGDGDGDAEICTTTSLFVVLQNDAGKIRFEINSASVARIISSMSAQSQADNVFAAPIGIAHDFVFPAMPNPSYFGSSVPPRSPAPQRAVRPDFGTIGGSHTSQHAFAPGSEVTGRGYTRRGRLFDLIDNGEEDDVDLVSGMLNNLDVGFLQNTNVGSDVDIEAISLMGIGGPTSHSVQPGRPHQARFL
jgi:hypothetical protein